jgi:SAM-dependent methyltransferase
MTDKKFKSEADFHDERITNEKSKRLGFAYKSVLDVFQFPVDYGFKNDEKILEIGCFNGEQVQQIKNCTFESYLGVDISPKAIEWCKKKFLDQRIKFIVENAESLGQIPSGSVSYAFGNGVLHHLDLVKFSQALNRVMMKGGVARFVEPAQGPWPLRLFRKITPKLRTPDEYPFDQDSIKILSKYFDVKIYRSAYTRPWIPILFCNRLLAIKFSSWLDKKISERMIFDDQAWLLKIELKKL